MTTDSVNLRELVLEILLSVTKDGMYSHMAISAVLDKYQYLTKQERRFITRVSEGTLEHMIELDYIINQFSNTKVGKMKPVIRCILRMGVYQLKYMNSVPASAACNEAVKLAVKKGFTNLRGFVNGVMRNISRNLENVSYPKETEDKSYAWSILYSIPQWMIVNWMRDYGEEKTKSMLEAFLHQYPTTIRVNQRKITPEELAHRLESQGITVNPVTFLECPQQDAPASRYTRHELNYALAIEGYDYLGALEEFREGLFSVQDISSMLVAEIAAPKQGDYVIDVCGAPGGKSLHIAELLQGTGHVDTRDLTEYKVGLIQENIIRTGLTNIEAKEADARVLEEDSIEKADIVIADLPCSGLGVLRKKTDIRYKMTEEKQKSLSLLQKEILAVVHQYVKQKGTLVYSTCTLNRQENEEVTQWFLTSYPQFTLEQQRQVFPDEGNGDGFYIAKFLRK